MNFTNYTDIALAAVRKAKIEASKMGMPFAGTGHLLLGIATVGGRSAKAMARAGVDALAIKRELQQLLPGGEQWDVTCEEMGISSGFLAALNYTQCSTVSNKAWVDDVSLLMALWAVSDPVSTASLILKRLGVTWMDLTAVIVEKVEPVNKPIFGDPDNEASATWAWSVQAGSQGETKDAIKMLAVEDESLGTDLGRLRYEQYMRNVYPAGIITYTDEIGKPPTAAETYKATEEMSTHQSVLMPSGVEYNQPDLPKNLLQEAASTLRSLAYDIVNLRVQTARHAVFTGSGADKQRKEYLQATHAAAESEYRRLCKLADRLDGTWEKEVQLPVQATTIIRNEAKETMSWLDETMGGGMITPSDESKSSEESQQDLVGEIAGNTAAVYLSLPESLEQVNIDPSVGAFVLPEGTIADLKERFVQEGAICPQGHHKLEGECKHWFCSCRCSRCREGCEKGGH